MSSEERPQPRCKQPARLTVLVLAIAAGVAPAREAGAGDAAALAPPPASPPNPAAPRLGRLEQESVDDALLDLGIRIDPHPEGKTIRAVHVVNQEVFSKRDWWFRWLNIFHRTTRGSIIERELLIHAGRPYDAALVEESLRNLQATSGITIAGVTFPAPDLSSVIVILPIIVPSSPSAPAPTTPAPVPGFVDLLVVTRDVWSLRFNTNFEFQGNTLSLLATSLSENNLFGWRKFLSYGLSLNLGAVWTGPTYFDPNVAGTRLQFYAAANAYYSRDTGHYEGDNESIALHYPLYSLASRWGGGVDVVHVDTLVRRFRGTSPRLVNLVDLGPDGFSPTLEPVPYVYRQKYVAVDANVVRQFGASVIQQIVFGHRVTSRHSEVPGDFPDPAKADLFLAQFAPVSETRSEPYIQYHIYTPRFAVYRDLNTFDLRENAVLGPSLTARIAYGAPELGADFRAIPLQLTVGWAVAPHGGLGAISLGAAARLRDGTFIDERLTATLYFASPIWGRAVRLVTSAVADTIRRDTQRTQFFLGGDNGLRGYAIGDFFGTSELVGHIELRTVPAAIFSQRFGGLLFYDVGDVAASFSDVVLKQDFGLGLRWLIPQLNSTVIRVDWALATQSTTLTRAGFPGRLSAGFQQLF